MSNFIRYGVGLGMAGAYQVSGKPFVSGGIDVTAATLAGTPLEIAFPTVTRWIIVRNMDTDGSTNDLIKVAASSTGFDNGNFFEMRDDYSTSYRRHSVTPRMEMKLTKLYLSGTSTHVDVIAGLTNIPTGSIPNGWAGIEGVG